MKVGSARRGGGDATTRALVNDTLALLGFDRAVCTAGDQTNFLRVS